MYVNNSAVIITKYILGYTIESKVILMSNVIYTYNTYVTNKQHNTVKLDTRISLEMHLSFYQTYNI